MKAGELMSFANGRKVRKRLTFKRFSKKITRSCLRDMEETDSLIQQRLAMLVISIGKCTRQSLPMATPPLDGFRLVYSTLLVYTLPRSRAAFLAAKCSLASGVTTTSTG